MSITAFGDRIALRQVEEDLGTQIVVPQQRNQHHLLGEALSCGSKTKGINIGKIYMFQLPVVNGRLLTTTYGKGKDTVIFQHYRDLIAELDRNMLTFDGFKPVGNWVLLEGKFNLSSTLQIPEQYRDMSDFKFTVAKLSDTHDEFEFGVGDVVVVNIERIAPVGLKLKDGTTRDYFWVDHQFVHGRVN